MESTSPARWAAAALAAFLPATPVVAADWIVDASGVQSPFTTIEQAMLQASPGDRILVVPGTYPAFHFSRGVDVIGLGTSPDDVVLERVDFHPNIPPLDWDAALSNLTVCGGGPGGGGVSGNELAPGTLVIEGVRTCGGIFLHGAGDFYLLMADSSIEPGPGSGFLNAAVDLGGGTFDIVDSRIDAADATIRAGTYPGVALRLSGGAIVRVSGSEVLGGEGADAQGLRNGATAIVRGFGAQPVELRLSGMTTVVGGQGANGGAGGAAVDLTAPILLGDATVSGGSGAPSGQDYAASGPVELGYDPHLVLDPPFAFAQAPVFMSLGTAVQMTADASLPSPMLASARQLEPPTTPDRSPLVVQTLVALPATGIDMLVARSQTNPIGDLPRRRAYFQVFFTDPRTGQTATTNPVALTTTR